MGPRSRGAVGDAPPKFHLSCAMLVSYVRHVKQGAPMDLSPKDLPFLKEIRINRLALLDVTKGV